MLRNEDLKAAVDAGVITAAQQTALQLQAANRHAARPFVAGRDERFRFLRGFNDVFLALGVALVTAAFLTQWSPARDAGTGYLFAGAAVLWAISEVVVGRYKAVLPGMVAVLGIGLLISLAAGHLAWDYGYRNIIGGTTDLKQSLWNYPFGVWLSGTGAGGAAVLIYYLRFGLPFCWLPMGYCLAQAVVLALNHQLGFERALPLVNAVSLALGLILFAVAMRFDSSDPERLTRRSDCGFWLHLAAAPFIVHPVISMLGSRNNPATASITIAVVAVLGIAALVVDRRALLVSSLLYFGIAVGYLVSQTTLATGTQGGLTLTLLLLGGFVIVMGLGWHRLRGFLLKPLAGTRWLTKLPPVQT